MSARQEKVREALKSTMCGEFGRAAAYAEVEEWEEQREADRVMLARQEDENRQLWNRAEAAKRLAAEWLNDAKGVPMDEALREIQEEIRTTPAGEEIQDVVEMTAQAWNEHYRQALERIQTLNDPTHAAQIATLALAGVGPNVQGLPPRGET